jgi:hypothetical protein
MPNHFCLPLQVKNKPYQHVEYGFILERSAVANKYSTYITLESWHLLNSTCYIKVPTHTEELLPTRSETMS